MALEDMQSSYGPANKKGKPGTGTSVDTLAFEGKKNEGHISQKSIYASTEKYGTPIPPVQVRHDECIGCQICAKACTKLTWDAIRMIKTEEFEETYDIELSG